MKAYRGAEAYLHTFLTSELAEGITGIIIIIIIIISSSSSSIHPLGRFGSNQSPVRRPVWLR
jgi:hypothetical protein